MGLRDEVIKGGAFLVARQGLGLVLGLGGMLFLTRLIGPAAYGLYTSAVALMVFLASIARLGVDVFLVRRQQQPDGAMYNQAFTLLCLTSAGVAVVTLLLSPLLGYWFKDERFVQALMLLCPVLPFMVLPAPALAQLERRLNYKAIAFLELAGQITYYVVTLPLAALGFKVWAPILGYWVWQVLVLVVSYRLAEYRPRLSWDIGRVREMIGYGLGYSASLWVWQLRALVNPLIVGRFLGPEAVGFVSLGIRLVESIGFAKSVTWRVSVAALAKIQDNYGKMKRALEEGMQLQILALGVLLAGFSTAAPLVVPMIFGERWTPVLTVFPFIAMGYLVNAVFNLHSSALYVVGRNTDVAVFHAVHIMLFGASAAVLVPRLGLSGYGLAELVALISYAAIHISTTRLFPVSYVDTVPWLVAFLAPLQASLYATPVRVLSWSILAVVLVVPKYRSLVVRCIELVLKRNLQT